MEEDLVEPQEPLSAGGQTPTDALRPEPRREPDEAERKLVQRITDRVKADKAHHKEAFDRMRRDMVLARLGASKEWAKRSYTANLIGRHIRQSVSALYAKNPKAVARRRPRLDFVLWDETEATLAAAKQTLDMFGPLLAPVTDPLTDQPAVDPTTGGPVRPAVPPEILAQVEGAQALLEDFKEGMTARMKVDKLGKTLEVLYEYYMQEQQPLDFKTAMKQLVRRARTTGCGFVEIQFQREYSGEPAAQGIADVRDQVAHIEAVAQKVTDPAMPEDEASRLEVQLSLQSLQEQEQVLLREGIVFDWPESTRVIVDKRTRALTGFVGARWISLEYFYDVDEVKEKFGVDLGQNFTAYSSDGKATENEPLTSGSMGSDTNSDTCGMACVWKHYDRAAGLVYYVCDGHKSFLKPPAKPDVYVESFWPVFALTFHENEDADEVYPRSDVSLMLDMQQAYNDARQGKREHRRAARPRFVSPKGALSDESKEALARAEPFSVTEVNPIGENMDVSRIVQAIDIPGVDPNLYDTNEIMQDMQLVVGSAASQFGTTSNSATATESSIAEGSREATNSSDADDLDGFLTRVARAVGQVMLKELQAETVLRIAGRGAFWPELSLEDLAGEVYLEIEAGSSGKPNAAQDIRNWREILPFLIQMSGIDPLWLARETLKRLDDRLDLTDVIGEEFMSVVAMNQNAQPAPGPADADPTAQGPAGAQNKGPAPQRGVAGGQPGMGNNQV